MKVFASINGRPTFIRGFPHSGWNGANPLDPGAKLLSFNFEITGDGADYFLLVSWSEDRAYGADSWHPSLDDAHRAAEEQFGIEGREWNLAG